ncbi:hypothetical protein FCULG_00000197 [Fusarium culmorum]|uniref:Uncharacterized protein n=1 Tax=Fusarium culmorum TaxID=5516 RepID=A0A2T4GKZ6_FUSCU|nr:hypothetical protein FCULG_00000197 [Fusarium culmorum]
MLSLQGIVVLLLCTASHAIPRHERDTTDEVLKVAIEPRPFEHIVNDIRAPPTDYRTMPPGIYTESISTGLVRIIVVNDPTPTTNKSCPAECDCSGIKDKKSPDAWPTLAVGRVESLQSLLLQRNRLLRVLLIAIVRRSRINRVQSTFNAWPTSTVNDVAWEERQV